MVRTPTERLFLALVVVTCAGVLLRHEAGSASVRSSAPPTLKVDANLAPAEVLSALPGLGPALASRMVEVRSQTPYQSLDDVDRRVKGIGPAKVKAIEPYLTFGLRSAESSSH